MIIPWQVDVPEDRYPWMNWVLISAIVGVFCLQLWNTIVEQQQRDSNEEMHQVMYDSETGEELSFSEMKKKKQEHQEKQVKESKMWIWVLEGWSIRGLFGHMWLHAGFLHLIGNLWFLWIFGNAVCAKIGNFKFLLIYLLVGLAAGVTHLIMVGGSMIGASGAINGIVGMFLVFFPRNDITCYFVFIFMIKPYVYEFVMSSFWMILFWLAYDILGAVLGYADPNSSGVAYFAHIGGFATGFAIGLIMLKTKMITMERYEQSILQIFEERNKPVEVETTTLPYGRYVSEMMKEGLIEDPTKDPATGSESARARAPDANCVPENNLPISNDELMNAGQNLSHEPFDMTMASQKAKQTERKIRSLGNVDKAEVKVDFIRFTCNCGKRVKIPRKYAGLKAKCPHCSQRIKIPSE
jgi:membrane associated rhomboid family serine protease